MEMSEVRETAILTEGLKKSYGEVLALDGVDFTVPRGSVFGLLGPNGAGKTTRSVSSPPSSAPRRGRAVVDGIDVARNPDVLTGEDQPDGQSAAVDEKLSGRENLRMLGRLSGHSGRPVAPRSRAARPLRSGRCRRPSRAYSGGMRRRLDLARALPRPPILFLDEPTTGLHARGRRDLWDVIARLVADGTTVLLTTQYLEEADHLADRIAVIDGGKMVAMGTSAH